MIEKHQGDITLKNSFDSVYKRLRSRGEADLVTSAGSSFAAKASIAGSGEHSGEPVIKFFHDGVEYARSYRCCWGHYYNCYRTRIGMYCKALDDFLDGGSSSGLHFREGVIILKFIDALIEILRKANRPLTPQEIRAEIKQNYPQFYGTASHKSNVAKGHYKDLDHALLAQIYSTVRQGNTFFCDISFKPMKVTLRKKEGKNTAKPTLPKGGYKNKNEDELISKIEYYYKRSLDVFQDFGGPSVYFHVQAIKEQESNFLSDRHIEMIYATLASWGMHKMGDPDKTKAKMVPFTDFKKSILTQKDEFIRRKRQINPIPLWS